MLNIFSCIAIPLSFFVRHMFRFFGPFFENWVVFFLLSFKSSLCILNSSVLSNRWFSNLFSQPMVVFSFPLTMSLKSRILNFEVQICSFMDYISGVITKESLVNQRSQRFSSRSFVMLDFTFKFVIHFELILVYIVKCMG